MKKYNLKLTLLAVLVGAVTLTGCSTPASETIAKNEIKLQQVRDDAAELKVQKEQKKAENILDNVPDWALNPPRQDANGIFAVGYGESKDLFTAIKKANLNAQYELAKNYKQELSGNEQSYTKETGSEGGVLQYKQLIDSIVDSVPVVGYEVVERKVFALDGKMNSYVLLKLPFDKYNAVLEQQKAESVDAEIKSAFNDLQVRLAERKKAAEVEAAPVKESIETEQKNTTVKS